MGVAAAASVLIAIGWFFRPRPEATGPQATSPFTLLSRAYGAERALFAGEGIIHIVNEIAVKPLSNPTLRECGGSRSCPWNQLASCGTIS